LESGKALVTPCYPPIPHSYVLFPVQVEIAVLASPAYTRMCDVADEASAMRLAFIGHAYHRKTGSSRFLIDLLERFATVEQWYGEPGSSAWGANFDESRYDIIVIWQLYEAFDLLSGRHPNVVFVPMYDAMFWAGNFYWRPAFAQAKILCFSWALRREVTNRGAV
jgi:hypothetical protein